jgi:hypothetical protein
MDFSLDSLRRLLMLGPALFLLACSGFGSQNGSASGAAGSAGGGGDMGGPAGGLVIPCMPSMTPIDQVFTVIAVDAPAAAWDACLGTGDCVALCQQRIPLSNPVQSGTVIASCQRVDPPLPDAGTDGGGDAGDASAADASGPQTIKIRLVGTQYSNCGDAR